METVTDNGTTYKKASVLAREFRYTPDYLGQLCRAKKVDARLVGRTWYVNPESLESHRRQRYSSVRQERRQSSESQTQPAQPERLRVETPVAKRTLRAIAGQKHFYEHADAQLARYAHDDTELVPQVRKAPRPNASEQAGATIDIGYFDSTDVPVAASAEDQATTFALEKPEPAVLHGNVSVTSVAETETETDPEPENKDSEQREMVQIKDISDKQDSVRNHHKTKLATESLEESEKSDEQELLAVESTPDDLPDDAAVTYPVEIARTWLGERHPGPVQHTEPAREGVQPRREPYQPRYRDTRDPGRELRVAAIAPTEPVPVQSGLIRYAPALAIVLGLVVGLAVLSVDHVLLSEGGERSSRFDINSANVSSLFSR